MTENEEKEPKATDASGSRVEHEGSEGFAGSASTKEDDIEASNEDAQGTARKRFSLQTWQWVLIVGAITCTLLLANVLITLPYYVISPGDAEAVKKHLSIANDKQFKEKGSVLLLTVTLKKGHPFDIAWAKLTPGSDIERVQDVRGSESEEEFSRENAAEMDDSQLTATYVALKQAGYDVKREGKGARVVQTRDGSPADGKLFADDTIVSLNDQPVRTAEELIAMIAAMKSGDNVKISVISPGGNARDVALALIDRPAGVGGIGPMVGAAVVTREPRLSLPFDVKFRTSEIGGPSAGLAFTLQILNQITPGDITHGKKIAATGTIDSNGKVGPVGGVKQKTIAAARAKATILFVPKDEAAIAKKYASSDLEVVPVETLQDALNALGARGGDISGATQKTVSVAA